MRINNILILLFVLQGHPLWGQLKYYATPLKIPVSLSGNFGELRPNHFHTGVDFRTERRTGVPVYASAEGYVSRVAVSPTGYGRVLYVNHPNQTTTVYGHLLQFRDDIEAYVKEEQYRLRSYSVDLELPQGKFLVAREERIALSGNSGSSGGPHLHYEIRDTPTQDALNPLGIDAFGAKDLTPPRITAVKFYPLGSQSHVEFKNAPRKYTPVLNGTGYRLNPARAITGGGKIGIAIQTNDFFDNNTSPCGIHKARLLINGTEIQSFTIDRIAFSNNRFLNSHIDYGEYVQSGARFHKLWREPGNLLPIYQEDTSRGIITLDSGQVVQGEIILSDVAGNTTRFSFALAGVAWPQPELPDSGTLHFSWQDENQFMAPDFEISTPPGAFYDDFGFRYQSTPSGNGFYSALHRVHAPETAVHKAVSLRIKAPLLPDSLISKAFVALIDDKGIPQYAGGRFVDGWMEASVREFGTYAVATDTIAPVITPLSIKNNSLTETAWIRFTIRDAFPGIHSYTGTIDGEWALFEYDPKFSRLAYRIDTARIGSGKRHTLHLNVTDHAGNTAVYSATFWK